ncbi:MAG TPA: adenylate kinase [candidate division Zixibacteria bacterium]|nr:adenylate kinase [candidate division Zixibacteria bacterium]
MSSDGPSGTDGGTGRRILLLVGAVGAGKGTQAEVLSERLGLVHLSSGELFRRALREGTPLGERARQYMERGELVPDDITIEMFMEELSAPAASRGAILDGFPRTRTQAEALDATLASRGERISRVIHIDVPPEDLVARVSGRRTCPTCGAVYHVTSDPPRVEGICDQDGTPLVQRDDDQEDVFRARLEKQIPPMLEVLEHYEAAGVVSRVDGSRSIDEVTAQIMAALGVEDA